MDQIAFWIPKKKNTSPTPCGFDRLGKNNAAARQMIPGMLNAVDAQGQVAQPWNPVVIRPSRDGIRGINLDLKTPFHREKKSGWLLAVAPMDRRAECLLIPPGQGGGITRCKTQVFREK